MVPIAADSGTMSSSTRMSDIAVTAAQRRPPTRRCSARNCGQVATTIIVAQMIAPRNGRRIHNEAAISPPITITVSRMRVSSRPWSSATEQTLNERPGAARNPGLEAFAVARGVESVAAARGVALDLMLRAKHSVALAELAPVRALAIEAGTTRNHQRKECEAEKYPHIHSLGTSARPRYRTLVQLI